MKNLLKLFMGFGLGAVTAVVIEVAPMMVPALLGVMAAVVILDSISDSKASA
ncbi:hypothetical protein [Marinomonas algicola]|uniref:hypothetical protein n=1 Tax=Marinomonas algicola TaxID=2773454 RepID=UPI00174CF3DE|nr:hypothetical protein [Marinomonas algicola]